MSRSGVLAELAARVLAVERPHPVRVALDGCSAAGKTTLGDELAAAIRERTARPVIRAGIDSFTRPVAARTAYPRDSPDSYYLDTWDRESIRDRLLRPLGPGGDRRYGTAVDATMLTAPADAILLADGVFLQRPELIDHWDLRVYVHIGFDEVLRRGVARDRAWMGADAERRYRTKYIPGERRYVDEIRPRERADIVLDNTNFAAPVLTIRR